MLAMHHESKHMIFMVESGSGAIALTRIQISDRYFLARLLPNKEISIDDFPLKH